MPALRRVVAACVVSSFLGCGSRESGQITLIVPRDLPTYFMLVQDAEAAKRHGCDFTVDEAGRFTFTVLSDGIGYASDLSAFNRWHKLWAKFDDGAKCLTEFDGPPPRETVVIRGAGSTGGADPRTKRQVKFVYGTLADYNRAFAMPRPFPGP
jgi:hypothetical protein